MIKRFKKIYLALPALVLALGILSPAASAASTLYVDGASGSDSSTCGSNASPCKTIQQAVNNSADNDTISVAAGTYKESVTVDHSVNLVGAGADKDARSRSGSETVIQTPSGQKRGIVVSAPDVTINGVTIDGSQADSPSVGVFAYNTTSSNLHVINSIIKNNKVGVDVLTADRSGLVVSHDLFDHNGATGSGDGVYISGGHGGNVTISDNEFRDTDDGTAGSTNAILVNGGASETLDGLTISGNTSSNDGSFIYLMNTTNTTVQNNTSSDQVGHGVLVGNNVSNMAVTDNTFTDSASGVRFVGTAVPATDVTIDNNTITGMSLAGVSITANSIGDGVKVTNNTMKNNAAKIQNDSGVQIVASNNNADPTATDDSGTSSGIKTPDSIDTGAGGAARHGVSLAWLTALGAVLVAVAAGVSLKLVRGRASR